MNIGKIIATIILIVVFLSVATAMYPVLTDAIDNVTGSGFTGTAILVIVKTIYWILAGAVVIAGFIKGMGLDEIMRDFGRSR